VGRKGRGWNWRKKKYGPGRKEGGISRRGGKTSRERGWRPVGRQANVSASDKVSMVERVDGGGSITRPTGIIKKVGTERGGNPDGLVREAAKTEKRMVL